MYDVVILNCPWLAMVMPSRCSKCIYLTFFYSLDLYYFTGNRQVLTAGIGRIYVIGTIVFKTFIFKRFICKFRSCQGKSVNGIVLEQCCVFLFNRRLIEFLFNSVQWRLESYKVIKVCKLVGMLSRHQLHSHLYSNRFVGVCDACLLQTHKLILWKRKRNFIWCWLA